MKHYHRLNRCKPSKAKRQKGTILLEFALVAPLILAVIFLILDIGLVMQARLVLLDAAREGARYAAYDAGASAGGTNTTVMDYLNNMDPKVAAACGASPSCIAVEPGSFATDPAGTPITVTLTLPASSVSLVPDNQLYNWAGFTLVVKASMAKEADPG